MSSVHQIFHLPNVFSHIRLNTRPSDSVYYSFMQQSSISETSRDSLSPNTCPILANSEYSNIRGILASIDFVVRTNTRIRECILMKHFNPALCGFLQMLLMFQSPLVIAAHKLF